MADWMAFNVADYVSNTMHLTTRQHGAYILAICAAFEAKGKLPGTDDGLRSITKLSKKEWATDGPVLKRFLTWRDGLWVHERVEHEYLKSEAMIEGKRIAGAEGARRRWHGRATGTANSTPITQPPPRQWQNDATITDTVRTHTAAASSPSSARASNGTPIAAAAAPEPVSRETPEPPPARRSSKPTPADHAFQHYQRAALDNGWPDPVILNSHTRWLIDQRLAEAQAIGGAMETFDLMLEKAGKAAFLREADGTAKHFVRLEWLVDSDNFQRTLEGYYDRVRSPATIESPATTAINTLSNMLAQTDPKAAPGDR